MQESSTYDQFPTPLHQTYYPHIVDEAPHLGSYRIPMTPSEFGSEHDSPYCSPRPITHPETMYLNSPMSLTAEKTHTTSGVSSITVLALSSANPPQRRRAQNRAAQRAFRERKEKHARDLEVQLSVLTEKYNKLEMSHSELNAAYEKLRKTIEVLTQDDDEEGDQDSVSRRKSNSSETLRKMFDILHGEFNGVRTVKSETT